MGAMDPFDAVVENVHGAIEEGQLNVVEALLDREDAHFIVDTIYNEKTALLLAVDLGDKAIISHLLIKNGDVNATCTSGYGADYYHMSNAHDELPPSKTFEYVEILI